MILNIAIWWLIFIHIYDITIAKRMRDTRLVTRHSESMRVCVYHVWLASTNPFHVHIRLNHSLCTNIHVTIDYHGISHHLFYFFSSFITKMKRVQISQKFSFLPYKRKHDNCKQRTWNCFELCGLLWRNVVLVLFCWYVRPKTVLHHKRVETKAVWNAVIFYNLIFSSCAQKKKFFFACIFSFKFNLRHLSFREKFLCQNFRVYILRKKIYS